MTTALAPRIRPDANLDLLAEVNATGPFLFRFKGREQRGASLEELSELFGRFRDHYDLTASRCPFVQVWDPTGSCVARISYNAVVWTWDGAEVLYDPYAEAREAERAAFAAASIQGVFSVVGEARA